MPRRGSPRGVARLGGLPIGGTRGAAGTFVGFIGAGSPKKANAQKWWGSARGVAGLGGLTPGAQRGAAGPGVEFSWRSRGVRRGRHEGPRRTPLCAWRQPGRVQILVTEWSRFWSRPRPDSGHGRVQILVVAGSRFWSRPGPDSGRGRVQIQDCRLTRLGNVAGPDGGLAFRPAGRCDLCIFSQRKIKENVC